MYGLFAVHVLIASQRTSFNEKTFKLFKIVRNRANLNLCTRLLISIYRLHALYATTMDAWELFRLMVLLVSAGLVGCQSTADEKSSENHSNENYLVNHLLETRKTNNELRQMVENVQMAMTGVTRLLQQLVVLTSTRYTYAIETRLKMVEMRLENLRTGVEINAVFK